MGTTVMVLLPEEVSSKLFSMVRRLFHHWDRTFSRFRQDSELSLVNAGDGQPVRVSPLFARVVQESLAASAATGGIFDPSMLRQIIGAGCDRTFSRMERRVLQNEFEPWAGGAWRFVRVDAAGSAVIMPPGTGLDFGGLAKGMAVDAAIEWLAGEGVPFAAVDAGGDLRVHSQPPGQPGWPVAVEVRDEYETVRVYEGAMATSTIAKRRWLRGGEVRHHLIDPRTGAPASTDVISVTAAATCCSQAEVAAKTALILGSEAGLQFLSSHCLSGLIVTETCEVRLGAWPDSQGAPA